MVVSGACHSHPKLLAGGRIWVWPWIQKIQYISLRIMTLTVESPNIFTKLGVQISVTGIAQVKIEGSPAQQTMLHDACKIFLGKTEEQIKHIAMETLEGHQRSIMGTMTVEEIFQDRQKFSHAVQEVASKDLVQMGITVVSYTIKDVSDAMGYLAALGVKRTCEVQRDANIGKAEAARDAGIKAAHADRMEKCAKFENDGAIAQSKRDYQVKQAGYDKEVNTQKANADFSYQLQAAKTKQQIRNEQVGILVVERAKEIQVQEQEIIRRERELEATVKKPAKAEKYRLEQKAEGDKTSAIMLAESEAESIQLKGEAEAYAVMVRAKATAEAMGKKAEAFKEYQGAALLEMVLNSLPKIAAEVASPLSNVPKITMIAGGDGDIGASKITSEIINIMGALPQMIQQMTGVDISKVMKTSNTSTA